MKIAKEIQSRKLILKKLQGDVREAIFNLSEKFSQLEIDKSQKIDNSDESISKIKSKCLKNYFFARVR